MNHRSPKLVFYYSPGACSLAPHIVLEEAKLPYEGKCVLLSEGRHLTEHFRAINPQSRVPALMTDGALLTECPAILTITINTAAEIATAPVISQLGKRFKLHPYRRANMLDAMTSAIGYIFPWGGGVLIGYQTIRTLGSEYDFVSAVPPTDVWPFVLHGWFLALVMLIAAISGFGRRYEAADGSETETPEIA